FARAVEDLINALARAHRDRFDKNPPPIAGFYALAVEAVSYLIDPFFFLGSIGKGQFKRIGWRRELLAFSSLLLFLATTRGNKQGKNTYSQQNPKVLCWVVHGIARTNIAVEC